MINFTAWPEMIAWPYLMLQGWLPYRDIAIAHNPLLLLDLVIFFKLFGVGIMQLKIYTWILIAVTTYLTYYVGKKFWSQKIGLVSSLFYLVLCIVYQGNGLWFDLALTPFALLLYLFIREKKYIWAGLIFAFGFLTKQTFIYFAIPVGIAIVQSTKYKVLRLKQFVAGSGIIFIFLAFIFLAFGILDDYYDWAIKFGVLYLPNAVGQISLPTLKQFVFGLIPFVFLIWNVDILIWLFAITGALGVYPRWELFHFQPALPFVALAISIFFYSHSKKLTKYISFALLFIFLIIGIKRNLGNVTRFYEKDVQAIVSELVTLNPKPNNLYIISYWDNIYAFTNTAPATKPLIPYIPWYLSYKYNRQSIINDLKVEMPEAIVIGERGNEFPDLYEFVDKYYVCNIIEKQVELCEKNKN